MIATILGICPIMRLDVEPLITKVTRFPGTGF